jgi:hypothetical protein
VLFLPLFHRKNPSSKVSQSGEFMPNFFQSLMPLAVSDLSLCFMVGLTPIVVVQFLKVCDLGAEVCNLVAKNCEMIHDDRIAYREA